MNALLTAPIEHLQHGVVTHSSGNHGQALAYAAHIKKYPAHIVVSSKGERVPIGDFLNEDEKEELVKHLERIIQELK